MSKLYLAKLGIIHNNIEDFAIKDMSFYWIKMFYVIQIFSPKIGRGMYDRISIFYKENVEPQKESFLIVKKHPFKRYTYREIYTEIEFKNVLEASNYYETGFPYVTKSTCIQIIKELKPKTLSEHYEIIKEYSEYHNDINAFSQFLKDTIKRGLENRQQYIDYYDKNYNPRNKRRQLAAEKEQEIEAQKEFNQEIRTLTRARRK